MGYGYEWDTMSKRDRKALAGAGMYPQDCFAELLNHMVSCKWSALTPFQREQMTKYFDDIERINKEQGR